MYHLQWQWPSSSFDIGCAHDFLQFAFANTHNIMFTMLTFLIIIITSSVHNVPKEEGKRTAPGSMENWLSLVWLEGGLELFNMKY